MVNNKTRKTQKKYKNKTKNKNPKLLLFLLAKKIKNFFIMQKK